MEHKIYTYLESILVDIQEIDLLRPGMSFSIFPSVDNNPQLKKMLLLMARINDIDSWLKNINNLISSINYSSNLAISTLKNKNNFWPFSNQNNEVFYYNENIMFRLISLWDLLAQLANTLFMTNEPVDRINYKKYFNKYSNTRYENEIFYDFMINVKDYLNVEVEFNQFEEINRKDLTIRWQGNHQIINKIRNGFTHKLNPHIMNIHNASTSGGGLILPSPPENELKRLIEDYQVLYECILILRKSIKYK